ncbi:MAG: metallophosphoesterase family protein, partial [Phycisphaerales bacterium]
MRTAVISDIHANLEALRAVLDHIDAQNVDRIICLGDILGYGPSPVECVDLVAERCEWSLMGNHDFGVLYEPTNFNVAAEQAAYWSREQFDLESDNGMSAKRWEFLSRLRVRVL